MIYPVYYVLHQLRSLFQEDIDLGFMIDSYASGQKSDYSRICDQIVNGILLAAINGTYAAPYTSPTHIINPTIVSNLTGATAGVNYEYIASGNNYRLGGISSSTDYWAVPSSSGVALRWDSNLACGTNGLIMSIPLPGANVASWDSTGSVNTFGLRSGAGNVKIRLVHVPVSADAVHNDDLLFYDGAILRSRQNLASSTNYGHACALEDVLVTGGTLTVYDENETTGTKPANNRSINLVTIVAYRVDASGDFIGGCVPYILADGSWGIGGVAADAVSTGNKQFSRAQYAAWLNAVTIDPTRKHVLVWTMDPESGTSSEVQSRTAAAMAVIDGAHDDIGRERPTHVWIAPYSNGNAAVAESFSDGIYLAAKAHGKSKFYSIGRATDFVYFDDSGADEDAVITALGGDDLTFGTVSSQDCTAAALLSDGVHPTQNGSALFTKLLDTAMTASETATMSFLTTVNSQSPVAAWRLNDAHPGASSTVGPVDSVGSNNLLRWPAAVGPPDTEFLYEQDGLIDSDPTVGCIKWITTATGTKAIYNSMADGTLDSDTIRTLEAWVKVADALADNQYGIIHRCRATSPDGPTYGYRLWVYVSGSGSSVQLSAQFNRTGTVKGLLSTATDVLALGEVAHFAATWDGTNNPKLYKNGVELAGSSNLTTISSTQGRIAIGGNTGGVGARFPGYIQEVRLYATALTEPQLLSHYDAAQDSGQPLGAGMGVGVGLGLRI